MAKTAINPLLTSAPKTAAPEELEPPPLPPTVVVVAVVEVEEGVELERVTVEEIWVTPLVVETVGTTMVADVETSPVVVTLGLAVREMAVCTMYRYSRRGGDGLRLSGSGDSDTRA